MKKVKEKKKLTEKQIIILIIVTIILGILCYFISTEITKSIIDHKTMEERKKNEDYSDLTELDTVSDMTLQELVDSFNKISDDKIDYEEIENNEIVINDIKISFDLKDDNNINIISINFNRKSKAKDLISSMIIASNGNINEETTELIYDKVFETLGTTENTSEFFQYQGLEFSLKELENSDYKYSFRIGRIVSNNTNEEE